MTSWRASPVTRFAFRHSLGWIQLSPIAAIILMESNGGAEGRPARLAVIALACAAPQAAICLLEAESDGRLDQMRLSGQPPGALALGTAAGGSAIWITIGLLSLLWTIASGGTVNTLLGILAVAGIPTAVSAAASTMAVSRNRLDPRIAAAALAMFSLGLAVAGAGTLRFAPWTGYYAIAIAVEAVIIAWCLRGLPRRIAHAPVERGKRPLVLHLPATAPLLRWPGFYRGICLSSSGLILFTIFAPMLIMIRVLAGAPVTPGNFLFYAPPLLIGLIAVSLICREDSMSGRLELVRHSSRNPFVATVELLVGLWAPFIAVAAGLWLLAWALMGVAPQGIVAVPILFLLIGPLPLVEGWSRLWPTMTVLPFAMALVTARGLRMPLDLVIVPALGWFAAVRLYENPDRPILAGPGAILIPALLCLPALWLFPGFDPVYGTVSVSAILFLTAQLLIDPKADRLTRWGQPAAVASMMMIESTVVADARFGIWAAAFSVTIWFSAYRIRQIAPERPAIQASIRIAVIVLAAQIEASMFESWPFSNQLSFLTSLLGIAAAAAVAAEIGYRISRVTKNK